MTVAPASIVTKDRPPSPAPRQKKRDPERTAAAILEAAVAEFSRHGYVGGRIDAIAKRAGVNKRMLYHYYRSKEGLYLAVLESCYAAIRAAELRLNLTGREPRASMRELVLFTWNYFLDYPEFLAVLAAENQQRARFLRESEQIVQLNSPLVTALGEVLASGAKQGLFRAGVDPVQLYISIASLGAFYLSNQWTLSTIFRRELATPDALAGWGDHIVDMVLAFLRP